VVGIAEPTPEVTATGPDEDARNAREDALALKRLEQFIDRQGWTRWLRCLVAVVDVRCGTDGHCEGS